MIDTKSEEKSVSTESNCPMSDQADWMAQLLHKVKRKNQILFDRESGLLQDLIFLLQGTSRRVQVLWALELARQSVEELESLYPQEMRPCNALEAARLWAMGRIRMPIARRAILDCHAVAKEWQDPYACALCHAIGQACAVVHTPRHALGYPIYQLTALVLRYGVEHCVDPITQRVQEYIDLLIHLQSEPVREAEEWAAFLLPKHK